MKITEIRSYLLTAPRDLHIVKIETDAGIYGLGEAGCSTREFAQEGARDVFPVMVEREGPHYPLPTRPGLGVELDEDALARHPFEIREHPHLSAPDGSYTNW